MSKAEIQEYKGHYIIFGADEITSGSWEVSLTTADADPDMTVKTFSIDKTFLNEEDALSYVYDFGKKTIDTFKDDNLQS